MPVRPIVLSDNPLLRRKSRRVRRVDPSLQELTDDMVETMRAANGIGLAAIQIGVPERVIVLQLPEEESEEGEQGEGKTPEESELYVIINPKLARKSRDPQARRESALKLFSEYYYQKPHEFSDVLTSTFPPGSPGAQRILESGRCWLRYEQFSQSFDIACRPYRLAESDPLYQATFWHNLLFNPSLPGDTVILGFDPDWTASSADPPLA